MNVINPRSNRFQALALLATSAVLAVGFAAWAQSPPVRDTFEIGDDLDPMIPGTADLLGDDLQAGPDWDNLFRADRGFRDVFDEFGNPGSNGMPDFLDTFGSLKLRRDAGFVLDDISAGSGLDLSILDSEGRVVSGTVPASHDLGNAYSFTLFNSARDLVIYGGVERLAAGAGRVDFEFNQDVFSIGEGGEILGSRTIGDLRLQASFSAEVLTALDAYRWDLVDAESGLYDWILVQTLPFSAENSAEQCNEDATLCVVCNASSIDGGSWPNYDAQGAVVQQLSSGNLLEFGINVSALLGAHSWENYYQTRFTSLQLSTYDGAATPAAKDYALGALTRAWRLANRGNW